MDARKPLPPCGALRVAPRGDAGTQVAQATQVAAVTINKAFTNGDVLETHKARASPSVVPTAVLSVLQTSWGLAERGGGRALARPGHPLPA